MYKKEKPKKKININIKNMGVNVDKNEYSEIVLSNTNRPEDSFMKEYTKKNAKQKRTI